MPAYYAGILNGGLFVYMCACLYCLFTCVFYICLDLFVIVLAFVTGPAKTDHVSTKNRRFLLCCLYHNLITIYTTGTKSSSLLQDLMGFLLQLTAIG